MLKQLEPNPSFSPTGITAPSILWKICHFDLSQGVPDLAPCPEARGLYAVFWWHQIPLGHLELAAHQLPLSARQLVPHLLPVITPTVGSHLLAQGFQAPLPGTFRHHHPVTTPDISALQALAAPLQQLQQQRLAQTQAQASRTVSIIICTHNRPEQLRRCLRSLQSLSAKPHEIIVVDNAPDSEATANLVDQFPDMRYMLEPRAGLSIARNTGIQAATGDIIAFTDDDVEVHPYWLDGLRSAFSDPNVVAVTGLVLPARLETGAEEIFQRGASGSGWGYRPLIFDCHFFNAMKPFGVPVWRIGAGANMAFRRHVFTQLGDFDERLGAGASGCSEDSEYWYRILAAGWHCRYEPTAVVAHYHRADYTSLNQQMRAYLKGHVVALWIQAIRHHHWGNVRRIAIALPRYYIKRLILSTLFRFRGKHHTTFAEIQGFLAGTGYYLRLLRNKKLDKLFKLENIE